MAKQKFYAVRKGKQPGIYTSWDACKRQVDGFSGAEYKSFQTEAEAKQYLDGGASEVQVEEDGDTLVAYVDGSYHVGTKEFSYGMVLLYQGGEEQFSQKVEEPELSEMRNVAGEIKGAEAAMAYAVKHQIPKLVIYHDYEGIAKWCTGAWQTKKEGTKVYKQYYDSIKDQVQIEFRKVKGHSGDRYNDLADQLAKKALGICYK